MTDNLLDAVIDNTYLMREVIEKLKADKGKTAEREKQLKTARPKAVYFDMFVDPGYALCFRDTAKEFQIPQKCFINLLIEHGFIFRNTRNELRPSAKGLEAICRSSSVPITFEPLSGNMDGYFSLDEQKIVIRDGMSEVQTVSALLHELAYSKLHNIKANEDKLQEVEVFGEKALFSNGRIEGEKLPDGLYCYDLRGSDNDPGEHVAVEENVSVNHAGCIICTKPIDIPETGFILLDDGLNFFSDEKGIREFLYEQYPEKAKLSRNTEEVQAESISFAVCAYYGIKTEENSFGYIASWSEGKEMSELKSSLETINKTSNTMITDIDKHYAEVKKERGLDNEQLDLDEAMFENSLNYLHIQRTDNAWDYSIYDKETLRLVDGGRIDNPDMKLEQIKEQIIAEYSVKLPYGEPLPDSDMNRLLDDISEKALSQMYTDLPDPNITQVDMNAYGYDYEEMLPLTKDTAQKLFETNAAIYMLHPDNTEAMVIGQHGNITL